MRDPRAELVRIDSHGQAHPIGNVASQRLRSREGTHRVLPAPAHMLFMRRVAADGLRSDADGPTVRLAGEITSTGALCDIVALLGQAAWRGELIVLDGDHARSIFFDQGNVVGASTNVESERIGSILYKFGAIDAATRDRVVGAQAGGKRFGEVLVDFGVLPQEKLYQYMAKQVAEILFGVLSVADGTFGFLDGFDDARLVVRHTVGAGIALMDAVTRMDEVRFFRQKIPSAEHVPVRTEPGVVPEDLAAIYAGIDGVTSIAELGRRTGVGEFETIKAVYALVQAHRVAIHPPHVSGGPSSIVAAANAALGSIFAAVGARGAELTANLASFAVGAGVYDILLRGAGPTSEGSFDVDKVVENSVLVAGGSDPVHVLRQMLHEYVSFALFSAGAMLGSGAESEAARQVAPMLAVLRPVG